MGCAREHGETTLRGSFVRRAGLAFGLFLPLLAWSCSRDPTARIAPYLGRIARVRVVANPEPPDRTLLWLEDVELTRLAGEGHSQRLVVRFIALEAAPANQGRPLEFPLELDRIVEIQVDGVPIFHADD